MWNANCCSAWCYALAGYVPGIIIGILIWLMVRRKAPIPFFLADFYGLALPILVWFLMNRYHWTLVRVEHSRWQELMVLGWVWNVCFWLRLIVPRFTHKLRFRMAALLTGFLSITAAVLLGLFFRGF